MVIGRESDGFVDVSFPTVDDDEDECMARTTVVLVLFHRCLSNSPLLLLLPLPPRRFDT